MRIAPPHDRKWLVSRHFDSEPPFAGLVFAALLKAPAHQVDDFGFWDVVVGEIGKLGRRFDFLGFSDLRKSLGSVRDNDSFRCGDDVLTHTPFLLGHQDSVFDLFAVEVQQLACAAYGRRFASHEITGLDGCINSRNGVNTFFTGQSNCRHKKASVVWRLLT